MASRTLTFLLVAANLLIPIAILVFASGFFPYKPFLSGLAQYEALEYGPSPDAPFDKLIFMVVDALRSDFVFSENSGFKFTQGLISQGAAIPFTAYATSPTITMPRIKAITTGSTPSFLDVILNFAESDTTSTLATQDTWLAQMKAKKTGKLVMYGDDTWLKLFPDVFDRSDGTSSFFVSDFTEVDNNVTRHVPEELKRDDWNTMILHYLGLDHIGHKTGPRGPNMIPKQKEMDGIVSQIYEAMATETALQSTLLVLAGDHGMNDAGNHGGSAPGETSPALVFVSPKLKEIYSGVKSPSPFREDFRYHTFVEQSDIAPTLGALLGFPVPRNNLGAMIVDFLPFWDKRNDKVQILLRNARQILNVVIATFPSFENDGPSHSCHEIPSDVERLACEWKAIMQQLQGLAEQDDAEAWQATISQWSKHAQELMTGTASNYDVPKLVTGQVVAMVALLLSFVTAWPTIVKSLLASLPLMTITVGYGSMLSASSYVEEEQHFWYWATSAWLALLSIKGYRKQISSLLVLSSIGVLVSVRIARRWNQTGQKWAGEPDIARTFFADHRITLWVLIGATYMWNLQCLASRGFSRFPKFVPGAIAASLATAAMVFKLAFTNEDSPELMIGFTRSITAANGELGVSLVSQARIVFVYLTFSLMYVVYSGFSRPRRTSVNLQSIHDLLVLLLVTQTRASNIPLFLLFELLFFLIRNQALTLLEITTTSLLLQHLSFFALGNSNAISSIDLSSAYNGIASYSPISVGLLTFISNWSGPIFWTSATNILLLRLREQNKLNKENERVWKGHVALLTVFTTGALFSMMAACTMLRTHLFIWTVFSPKFLYSMAWSIGQHLGVNVVVGGVLYWLGTKYV